MDALRRSPPSLKGYRARFSARIPACVHALCIVVESAVSFARLPVRRELKRTCQMRRQQPNESFFLAVAARQGIDLRIGSAFTRLLTLTLANTYSNLPKVLVWLAIVCAAMFVLSLRCAGRLPSYIGHQLRPVPISNSRVRCRTISTNYAIRSAGVLVY